ncbi:MAG: hypothetical protein WCD35_10795 [Mycobacteriales bacterium]
MDPAGRVHVRCSLRGSAAWAGDDVRDDVPDRAVLVVVGAGVADGLDVGDGDGLGC